VREVEADTDIGILYARWQSLGAPPHKDRFRPRSVNAACFRVASPMPLDYVYMSTDEPTKILPLRKLGNDLMQRQAIDDLMMVKERCEPLYEQVIHRIGRTELCFRRILLPVINDVRRVELIYTATRQFGTVEAEYFDVEDLELA
jgi:hypothetical protein